MKGSQRLQRGQGIRHLDETGVGSLQRIGNHGIGGTGLQGLQGKVVSIEILSFQRQEKLAGPEGTAIGTKAFGSLVYLI